MALSLMLRSASKIQGYPCILRCTPIALKNVGNISCLTSSTNAAKKSLALTNQIIKTPTRRTMSAGGDHRMMWTIERLFSLGLLGVLPIAIISPNPILDNVAAVMMTLHFHWGLEAMSQDYVRPIIFGNTIPKVSIVAVYVISTITLAGLLYFNYNDIGLGKAVRKLWSIKPAN